MNSLDTSLLTTLWEMRADIEKLGRPTQAAEQVANISLRALALRYVRAARESDVLDRRISNTRRCGESRQALQSQQGKPD